MRFVQGAGLGGDSSGGGMRRGGSGAGGACMWRRLGGKGGGDVGGRSVQRHEGRRSAFVMHHALQGLIIVGAGGRAVGRVSRVGAAFRAWHADVARDRTDTRP